MLLLLCYYAFSVKYYIEKKEKNTLIFYISR